MHLLLLSKPTIDAINSPHLRRRDGRADLGRTLCDVDHPPPPPEQAAIGRFLDHVDRRIRRYIRAKQKLIKLLEEQKQAIIHRAVTRGLDPNVRLKPSGVEWLGEVPEHWEVLRLRRCRGTIKFSRGGDRSGCRMSVRRLLDVDARLQVNFESRALVHLSA